MRVRPLVVCGAAMVTGCSLIYAGDLDDAKAQKKIAVDIQKHVYDEVLDIPLGQYLTTAAWRKSLSGILDGPATPVFWNVDKSE